MNLIFKVNFISFHFFIVMKMRITLNLAPSPPLLFCSHHRECYHENSQHPPPHQDHLWLAPLPASWLKSRRSRLPLAAPQSKPGHDDDHLYHHDLDNDDREYEREDEGDLSILLFFSSALSSPPPKLIVNATGESLSSS